MFSMSRNKSNAPSSILVVDSNVLFTKNDIEIVNSTFADELLECRKHQRIELFLPDCVAAEIVFRKVELATQLAADAQRTLRMLARLTASQEHAIDVRDSLRKRIEERFAKWCKEIGASLISTPIDKINWQEVIEAAIWHLPPFSPSNVKSEKGFKDALILETVGAIRSANEGRSLVFVTGDKLLRDTAIMRHGVGDLFTAYERLNEYLSYLKLLSEQNARDFSNKAIAAAPKVFFDPDSEESLFVRSKVKEQIESNFEFLLNIPPKAPETLQYLSTHSRKNARWIPTTPPSVTVGSTNFQRTGADGFYYWISEVFVARVYREEQGSVSWGGPKELIQVHKFGVNWKCRIAPTGEFSDATLINISFPSATTEPATVIALIRYRLPSIVERWFTKQFPEEVAAGDETAAGDSENEA